MASKRKQLPDALLAEVWTVMHLAVASDVAGFLHTGGSGKSPDCKENDFSSGFIAEGEVSFEEMQSDSPFDGNANEGSVCDRQAMKDAAEKLVVIGDHYSQEKGEENKLIDDIVECLNSRAKNIDEKLERELCSPVPANEIFQDSLVSIAYGEVKTRLETFLVGSEGFDKIALVAHITKGVSTALRDVSAPAVTLAAAISYRFVTEKYADLILKSGGLRNLVASNS